MLTRRRLMATGAALGAGVAGTGVVPLARAQNPFITAQWPATDFTRLAVPLEEIRSGGVGRDGIPALDRAEFMPADRGGAQDLGAAEAVITVAIDGAAERAYPVRYLMWHEIVNDTLAVDGQTIPFTVTYCPLCNSALVFDGRLGDRVLTFGVTGNLRFSDMVMYDRQTESWWQQFTGAGIVGTLMGAQLTQLVSWMEPVSAFVARNPSGAIMQEPQGFARAYGRNPYVGYDGSARPFLYDGENPPHDIAPLERVVRVGNRAWPLSRFADTATITEAGVRLEWRAGMASSLDGPSLSDSRDIGSIRVFDAATGADVLHEVVFAFAFHAFEPDGIWMLG